MDETAQPGALILAAGGIVERRSAEGLKIAVIHRQLYGSEWCLPKGKQDPGETLEQTALREVVEETGCCCRITDFAGCINYYHGNNPKIVVFWVMAPESDCRFMPSPEVAELEWLSIQEALGRLAHSEERHLLAQVYDTTLC